MGLESIWGPLGLWRQVERRLRALGGEYGALADMAGRVVDRPPDSGSSDGLIWESDLILGGLWVSVYSTGSTTELAIMEDRQADTGTKYLPLAAFPNP